MLACCKWNDPQRLTITFEKCPVNVPVCVMHRYDVGREGWPTSYLRGLALIKCVVLDPGGYSIGIEMAKMARMASYNPHLTDTGYVRACRLGEYHIAVLHLPFVLVIQCPDCSRHLVMSWDLIILYTKNRCHGFFLVLCANV